MIIINLCTAMAVNIFCLLLTV